MCLQALKAKTSKSILFFLWSSYVVTICSYVYLGYIDVSFVVLGSCFRLYEVLNLSQLIKHQHGNCDTHRLVF
jgi:hypothetical protein